MILIEQKANQLGESLSFSKATLADIDRQMKELQKRKKEIEGGLDQFKNELRVAMADNGITRIEAGSIKFRLDPPASQVTIDDESLLPEKCFVTTRTVSKEIIKGLLKSGEDVPGARITEGKHRLVILGE